MRLTPSRNWISIASILTLVVGVTVPQSANADGGGYPVPIVERFEKPPEGELGTIDRLVKHSTEHLAAMHRADGKDAVARRDAHAKHHGCVIAQFEVADDLPTEFAHGVFQRGARYDSLVRFSNGNPTPQADRIGDGRGMAIKLLGVGGTKLLDRLVSTTDSGRSEEHSTQDFLLINYPVFFIPDVDTYEPFLNATDSGSGLRQVLFFARHLCLFGIVRKLTRQDVYSPLEISYHSMTPYLLGSHTEGQAVKYRTDPVICSTGRHVDQVERKHERDTDDDFLRHVMAARLSVQQADDVCFDFSAVVRRSDSLSIEDATSEWSPPGVDVVRLARLTIARQSFDSDRQLTFCENLSFSPWHTLPEHQPLGGLNRLRLQIYRTTNSLRHGLNRVPLAEPHGASWPELLSGLPED